MRHPSYEHYEKTLAPWLNKRPTTWEERKLKFGVYLINKKVTAKEFDLEFLGLEHIESWTGKRIFNPNSQSDGTATKFESNDVLFGKLRPYLAKVYKAEKEGLATTEALILRSGSDIEPDFLKYYLLSSELIDVVDGSTYGSKMPRANYEFIGNLSTLVPEKEEQTKITTFLDYKTAKIDRLIEKKQALIEKLNEQRIAVITQAVTKGLNPDVPMKDSEVDWLGEVPEHWKVRRLKFCCSYNDESLPDTTDSDLELNYVDISSVNNFKGITHIDSTTFKKAPSRARRIAKTGDIIVSTVRTYLKAITPILDEITNLIVSTGFVVIRANRNIINSNFLSYSILSKGFIDSVVAYSKGVSYPAINASELVTIPIAFPRRKSDQDKIADYIKNKISSINRMIAVNIKTIDRLSEYRTALITAAVTGKIDVRHIDIPNTEHTNGTSTQ